MKSLIITLLIAIVVGVIAAYCVCGRDDEE